MPAYHKDATAVHVSKAPTAHMAGAVQGEEMSKEGVVSDTLYFVVWIHL